MDLQLLQIANFQLTTKRLSRSVSFATEGLKNLDSSKHSIFIYKTYFAEFY